MPTNPTLKPRIWESKTSRQITKDSATLEFEIRNVPDHNDAVMLLSDSAPAMFFVDGRFLKFTDYSLDPLGAANDGAWRCRVDYGSSKPETNDISLSFDISAETQHITQSLETVGVFVPEGKTAVDFKGAIGVEDGEVKGCDIPVPKLSFGWTRYVPKSLVTTGWVKELASICGRINDGPFLDFTRGEVLFIGATGGRRMRDDDWEINFKFDASPTVTNIPVGDIVVQEKLGFDYLWVAYHHEEDTAGKKVAARPYQANVERVLRFADFTPLGITVS